MRTKLDIYVILSGMKYMIERLCICRHHSMTLRVIFCIKANLCGCLLSIYFILALNIYVSTGDGSNISVSVLTQYPLSLSLFGLTDINGVYNYLLST